jgi:DNA-binding LacI/PurR family transcriptional regulator
MTRAQMMLIAGEASCDVRTVKKYLDGQPISALPKERIEAAMKRLGLSAKRDRAKG